MLACSSVARRVAGQSLRSPTRLLLSAQRYMSELPYHHVVGMPALSPTMEMGTLAEWNVKQGDSFIAGDSLAKIETDKASIDFEAQDDGHVAKLLVEEGTPDITVGTLIMVTVEEAEHVAAFADYKVPEVEAADAPEEPKKEKVAAPSPPMEAAVPPPPPPAPVVEAPPAAPPAVEAPPPIAAAATITGVPTMSPAWGNLASVSSPIAKTLSASQKKYIEQYGTTGQVPL